MQRVEHTKRQNFKQKDNQTDQHEDSSIDILTVGQTKRRQANKEARTHCMQAKIKKAARQYLGDL